MDILESTSVVDVVAIVGPLIMTRTSALADALNAINNAEKTGKRQVLIRPSSKVIIKFLSVMQKHGMYLNLYRVWSPESEAWTVPCCLLSFRKNKNSGKDSLWT
ncbi:hypothetical protein PACTADRAFT_14799 [Pachysolen tannophilus NRRL Y-2460]|uniref:Uncharacterized protein n=1 Tax=Pachysolen tannophilus NRRL Y-2460 TaxID=669874 RepID=A0A1E4U2V7_PACTA|nr:hypothetical protein PACTADRAFT_14799 [Pachysolen tannophilus NRRL Y-2460]